MQQPKFFHAFMVLFLFVSSFTPAATLGSQLTGRIIYVDVDATGANNGTGWVDAFTTLQPALDAAVATDQVWVAEGSYYPTAQFCGTGDRYASFQLKNGVAVYGGFDPTVGDVSWDDRDWEAHTTILSGDIGVAGNSSDNSYHVFCHTLLLGLNTSAILDGFSITGGQGGDGAGMYNSQASPTLTNINFSGNTAVYNGGGMFNESSSPALTNVTFSGNTALYGGGMWNGGSSPVLNHVTFSENSAYQGGGMCNSYSSPTLTNVTFSGSTASFGGGMYNIYDSSPALINVTFSNNTASFGGGMYNDHSSPTLRNVTFSGNIADYGSGGGMYNYSASSPTLTNSILWGDKPDEIVNSVASNPTVTYSDIRGGYTGTGNINLDPRLGPLADKGGFVLTHALGFGSPAIDAGNPDPSTCPASDARGASRPADGNQDGNPVCDMGAYEFMLAVFLPLVAK